MFEMSQTYENMFRHEDAHVYTLAQKTQICLKTWWRRMWRLHMNIVRQSIKRVLSLGSVQHAMQNTDLCFFINTYRAELQTILDKSKSA